MSAINQVTQILNRWRLVLNQNEQQVQGQSCQSLTVARLVNGANVGDTLYTRNEKIKLR